MVLLLATEVELEDGKYARASEDYRSGAQEERDC